MKSETMHQLLAALKRHFDTTPHWAKTNSATLERLEKIVMAISAEVQKVLDDIAANKSVAASTAAGVQLLLTQIADLKTQIAAIPVGGLSAEDKAALTQGATDLESTTTALGTAIPAGASAP